MSEILNDIFGAELLASLSPDVKALLCMFCFALCAWVIVRIFRAIGGFF